MIKLSELGKYKLPKPSLPPIEFMTDEQLMAEQGNVFVFDIECFHNYFLIAMKSYVTGRVLFFERHDDQDFNTAKLQWIVDNMTLVGFNNKGYDNPMLWAAMAGLWDTQLKCVSDAIILHQKRTYELEREFKFKIGFMNDIDLMMIAPSAAAMCSLKHYGARMHVKRLQDLPIDPMAYLTHHEKQTIRLYCVNDLDATGWLYHKLQEPIKLREEMGVEYGSDLRSLSDAQIAERVIVSEIQSLSGVAPRRPNIPQGTMFRFQHPEYIRFFTDKLRELYYDILATDFVIDGAGKVRVMRNGQAVSATNLWAVTIGQSTYRLGIGGLHSSETKQTYFTDDKHILFDRDVASYYPAIILNQGLYPSHIGPDFLKVYSQIVQRRLEAKKAGDKSTANSLKIAINGSFGKLGSKWSPFYSPELLIQVTLSGQLSLLMLIEMFEWSGISVVSANTDGIVVRCPSDRQNAYQGVVSDWERLTGFETEETRYASIHSRDVNNYIAVTESGGFKAKGAYVNDLSMKDHNRESLMKNPNGSICSEAVMHFLRACNSNEMRVENMHIIADTIRNCKDVTKFIFAKRVSGGAVKDQQYLGKIIRWYMRFGEFGCIRYLEPNAKGVKNTVSESTGSYPVMDIEGMPTDLDYDWYIRRAYSILRDVGFGRTGCKTQQMLF